MLNANPTHPPEKRKWSFIDIDIDRVRKRLRRENKMREIGGRGEGNTAAGLWSFASEHYHHQLTAR